MRKYVRNFAKIATPMTHLLISKLERITWTCYCQASFEILSKALTKALVLRIMDPLKGELVFMPEGKVITYESKKLNNVELIHHVHEKKILAIIHTLKFWRHYLLGGEFKLKTNHQSLRYLTNESNLNCRQSRGMDLMQSLILRSNM